MSKRFLVFVQATSQVNTPLVGLTMECRIMG